MEESMPHLAFLAGSSNIDVSNGQGMDALMEDVKQRGLQLELDRLRDMHEVYTDAADGKYTLAPIDWKKPGLRVLDSATADAVWIQDAQKLAGDAVATQMWVGTDLVGELFPNPIPPNITFAKQSITEPWPQEWQGSFDLVHQRQVLGFCGDFPIKQAVANLCALAKPGGWVELVELNADQTILGEATVAREFFDLLEQIWQIKNMGGNFGQDLKRYMEEAGLEDVEETLLRNKVGVKALPGKMDSSINGALGAGPMIIAMAKTLPIKGFTQEQLDTLYERTEKEMRTIGSEFDSFAVRGRVPTGGLKPRVCYMSPALLSSRRTYSDVQ